jgi:NAD(P)-dependent dehydrogenase (short-subunit alcohol dehydrogenase family)
MPGVEGRVAVVTGAGGGLGRQHALLFAQRGARVVVNDLGGSRDGSGAGSEMADSVVEEIKGLGAEAVANYDNVAEPSGAAGIIQTALDAFGQVDIIVNNAGILRDVSFTKMEDAQWDAVLKVHLYGSYNVTKAAWPHFREQSYGRVVMTTSTSGIYGNFGQTNYGAAKLGMVGMMNTLVFEGAKYNIKVNAIAPVAATRMTEDIMPDEMLSALDPAFVSPAVVHMAGEEFDESGLVILAGGGQYARIAYFQSPGVNLPEVPGVDELAERWAELTDMSNATLGKQLGT